MRKKTRIFTGLAIWMFSTSLLASFAEGQKFECFDDVSGEAYHLKITDYSDFGQEQGYVKVTENGDFKRFYDKTETVLTYSDWDFEIGQEDLEFSLWTDDEYIEEITIHYHINEEAYSGTYADRGDSRGIDCELIN